MFNKESLINDLKELHSEIVEVYKNIFKHKLENDSSFQISIEEEYKRERLEKADEKTSWNVQYVHRSAYTLLNKILFIRICEDKGFMLNEEDKIMGVELNTSSGQKLSMLGLQKWTNLISNYTLSELVKFAFLDMNKSYNNISLYKDDKYDWLIPSKRDIDLLFSEEDANGQSQINEFEILVRKIIETLDTSNYNFDKSTDNVLGDVYENFMDRETRKSLGQFYTPEYIIEYILESTMSNVNVVNNPFIKVLDPSCGSGHFLIKAYDLLRKKFEENLDDLQKRYKDENYEVYSGDNKLIVKGSEYWSKKYLHYHILSNCLYGADIDGFALQLTTINLLLKDLDNFITDRLNIIEGDSLIKWEKDYSWENLKENMRNGLFLDVSERDLTGNTKTISVSWKEAEDLVSKGEFWSQKFDYVIGNPPYLNLYELNPQMRKYLSVVDEEIFTNKNDIMYHFLKRAYEVVKPESGKIGFVISRYILEAYNAKLTREFLKNRYTFEELIDFGNIEMFEGINTRVIIFKASKKFKQNLTRPKINVCVVNNWDKSREEITNYIKERWSNVVYSDEYIDIFPFLQSNLDNNKWVLVNSTNLSIKNKLENNSQYLGRKEGICQIGMGMQTGRDGIFTVSEKEINEYKLEPQYLKKLIKNGDIRGYEINDRSLYWIYTVDIKDIDEAPNIRDYLYRHYDDLMQRYPCKIGKKKWYEYTVENIKELFEKDKKIVVPYKAPENRFALDTKKRISSMDVYILVPKPKYEEYLLYIIALMNSTLMQYAYKKFYGRRKKAEFDYYTDLLSSVPVKLPEKNELNNINEHVEHVHEYKERLKELEFVLDVESEEILLGSIKNIDNREKLISKIEIIKEVIDEIIYKIYGLSNSEIEFIKSQVNGYKEEDKDLNRFRELNKIIDSKLLRNLYSTKAHMLTDTISSDEFMVMHSALFNNNSISEIADNLNLKYSTVRYLKENFTEEIEGSELPNFYNFDLLYNNIEDYISDQVKRYLNKYNAYSSTIEIINNLDGPLLKQLMIIMKKGGTIKSTKIINDCIKSETWNSFVKNRNKSKSLKEFVKYDTSIYGLSNWSDEIHKKFFIDAIDYYTSNSDDKYNGTAFDGIRITKKRAETALKNLQQLDFEDKEDYLEILTEKVKKAFE